MNPIKPFFADRSLYLTVFAMVLPFISAKLGVPLDAGKCADLAVVVAAFVLAHKGQTWAVFATQMKHDALAVVAPDGTPAQTTTINVLPTVAPSIPPIAIGIEEKPKP